MPTPQASAKHHADLPSVQPNELTQILLVFSALPPIFLCKPVHVSEL